MTNPGNRANDRAVRAYQAANPGMSLSDARRAVAASRTAAAETAALVKSLRGLHRAAGTRPPLWPLGGIGSGSEGEVAVDLNAPLLGRTVRDVRDLLRSGLSWG